MQSNKDRMKEVAEQWFPNHAIDLQVNDVDGKTGVEILRWRKPGTWCYFVEYIAKNGTLFVRGDIGEAVYCWSDKISLEWVSGLDLHYFHSKCQASEYGRNTECYAWDEGKALDYIHDHFKQNRDCKGFKKFQDADVPTHSKNEFEAWLNQNNPEEIFGYDWWESFPGCGSVVPIRIIGHLVGLKMAFNKMGS